ncbi:MAG: hypothetical protein RLZZ618_2815 [Pseudomonadota bacterium]|jgi:uncharacterized protein (DUF1800 family)
MLASTMQDHQTEGSTAFADDTAAAQSHAATETPTETPTVARTAATLGAALAASAALAACGGGTGTPGPTSSETTTNTAGRGGSEPPPPTPAEQMTAIDAARFLSQATFGQRSAEEVTALQETGYRRWLWQQFNAPTQVHTSYLEWQAQLQADGRVTDDMSYESIWQHWLHGDDQLRARVAFALSQIIVVSNSSQALRAFGIASYMDLLNREAFGNYRTLLRDVTLHPTMGYFLNMIESQKAVPARGIRPNENYAREILQLFSVGLVRLNIDGTPQLDGAGVPIPTYDETVVLALARAFTGWSSGMGKRFSDVDVNVNANWYTPMKSYPEYHATDSKMLLDGFVIPAGGTPESDIEAAIDNIFNHPNVGPFVCKQLIQRLVTSNPSPAYVARVATTFNNDGSGVRGNLRAVVTAILTDTEARTPSLAAGGRFGKQREPAIRFANLMRALNAKSANGRNDIHELDNGDNSLGQSPMLAPTVFNFFLPSFSQAGPIMQAGLVAPEFQITTETTVVGSLNFFASVIKNGGFGNGASRLKLDFEPLKALASDPAVLVDKLNVLFFNCQMSAVTRTRLVTLIAALPAAQTENRVKSALIVVFVSPDFVIQT